MHRAAGPLACLPHACQQRAMLMTTVAPACNSNTCPCKTSFISSLTSASMAVLTPLMAVEQSKMRLILDSTDVTAVWAVSRHRTCANSVTPITQSAALQAACLRPACHLDRLGLKQATKLLLGNNHKLKHCMMAAWLHSQQVPAC